MLLALAGLAQAVRVLLIERTYGEAAGCDGCLVQGVLGSDAGFWLIWLILAWAGFALRHRGLARLLRIVCALLLLFYVLDVYVMRNFNSRMYFAWLMVVGGTPAPVLDHLAATVEWWRWMIVVGGLSVLFWLVWKHPESPPGAVGKGVLALALTGCTIAVFASQPVYYVHGWVVGNVFDQSGARTFRQPYGEATLAKLPQPVAAEADCRDSSGARARRDIVLLILESWSPYQSELLTGLNDWTPRLDRLQREHGHFERMMANGYSTNHGLMALLTGLPVMPTLVPPLQRRSFQPAWGWPDTIPKQLGRSGYETAFMTSGDLAFTGKGDWLRHIGFDYIEGHDHPFYSGMRRLHFQAVPDRALYDRVTAYLAEREASAPPLALVVESVSSHNPFIHPETRERDEEAVFRYMDATAAEFIESVRAGGFIEQGGVLVVVSDHRAMKAISAEELNVLGHDAHARIPMMMIGNDLPPVDPSALWAQSDLGASLIALTTGRACGYPGWRNLFASPDAARCVFHTRGDDRNLIEVYCESGQGTVRLAGDDSRFLTQTGLSLRRQEDLLLELARLRLIADAHNDSFPDSK